MKNGAVLTLSIAALLLAGASFVLNGGSQAAAQLARALPMGCNQILWDYDSGWVRMNPHKYRRLTHNLGGDPNEYFIDYSVKGETCGISICEVGGVFHGDEKRGSYWLRCTDTDIDLFRHFHDYAAEMIRVRILKNQ